MSNKGDRHNKRWLISRLKTSGSKRRYVNDGDYADTRNTKKNNNWDELPTFEGMGQSSKFQNKINYGLLIRFLRGKNGSDWEDVQKEVSERIPSNLIEYKDCLKRFVADLVEEREGRIWDKREQKFLRLHPNDSYYFKYNVFKEFYVDPNTNKLVRIDDFPSKNITKGMSKEELREFREKEKKYKLAHKESKRLEKNKIKKEVKEILKNKSE